jgi:SH3-like domain-containing protein
LQAWIDVGVPLDLQGDQRDWHRVCDARGCEGGCEGGGDRARDGKRHVLIDSSNVRTEAGTGAYSAGDTCFEAGEEVSYCYSILC